MRLRLTPRETAFFDLLAASAQHLVTAAGLLAEMLGADRLGRVALAEQLAELERTADRTTHEIVRRLASTFVTPLDREDIYALAGALDDCMDQMEAAADLMVRYRVDRLPAGVAEQVEVLARAAELTADAMPGLRATSGLSEYWVEVNRLENQADKACRRLLGELFDQVRDPLELLKVKEVVETLEQAAGAFERVAHTVESIALKES